MDYYELIQAYRDNTLTADERKAFEAEMQRDDQLRMTVEQFPAILDAINAAAQDDTRKMVSNIRMNLRGTGTAPRRIIPRQLQIAATVLIVVVAGLITYSNISYSTTALANAAYEAPSDLGGLKSDDTSNESWNLVISALDRGDKDETIDLAQKFLDAHQDDPDVTRRVAYVYFQLGEYAKSLTLLKALQDSDQFGDYGDFHYAVVLLRLHREKEARAMLNSITADPDHYFRDEAKRMNARLSSPLHSLAFQ